MRIIDSTILAQLAARELRPFQLLEMTLAGGTYRYTDCDVPIGEQLRKQTITDGPVNHGLCLANGFAFAKLNGLDLSPFRNSGYLLTLTDGAAKTATGYISAADAAETLGSELVTNGNFSSPIGTTWVNDAVGPYPYDTLEIAAGKLHLVTDGGTTTHAGSQDSIAVVAGKLYKITWTQAITSGVGSRFGIINGLLGAGGTWRYPAGGPALLGAGTFTVYWTATVTENAVFGFYNVPGDGATEFTLDDVSVKEVTHVGATGVHVVSAAGGSILNWASIESGFNYNDSSYVAKISGSRFEPRGFKHDGARYSLGRIVDKVTVEIDNVDEQLSAEFIGGDPQGKAVSLKEVVLGVDNLVVGHPITWFVGTIDDWDGEEGHLRVSIVGPNYAWSRRTSGRHPSSCRWRVFKGAECIYAGSGAFCDRSFSRCAALGNVNEFGGFRWLPSIENKEVLWGRKA